MVCVFLYRKSMTSQTTPIVLPSPVRTTKDDNFSISQY